MVLHARHGAAEIIVSLKPESVALSLDGQAVLSWDRGGRLYSVWEDGVTWRRGLSGHIIEKRTAGGERVRRVPTRDVADAMVDEAARRARNVADAMMSASWRWKEPVDSVTVREAHVLLALCGRFTASAAREDAARFAAVYSPVGMLPPDQYLSLVVQLTEGCSFNTCTFCDLYHEPYRVKTPAEFSAHLSGVLRFLGESRALRSRGVFLGAANALAVPMPRLVPTLEILADEVDALRRGVFAFVDGFTGQLKDVGDYRVLRHLGLRRVYVGLESGHDPLLAYVRKPGTAATAVETVRTIKAAGVAVGVIVMTGLGGSRFSAGHVTDTAGAIAAMELGPGDLLYFSDLVEPTSATRPALVTPDPLSPLERQAQRLAIREGARLTPGASPRAAVYDVREFVY